MFLTTTIERNPALLEYAYACHKAGKVLPDTYLIDVDTLLENAEHILQMSNEQHIELYYMLKQLGRNPVLAGKLQDLGFSGAVCVDFREALLYTRHQLRIGHVGHLTQLPTGALQEILAGHPEIITVYSLEKAKQINDICMEMGYHQDLMVRVVGEHDFLYPGQYGGFTAQELECLAPQFHKLPAVSIKGVTSFPCFLYDQEKNDIVATENSKTVVAGSKLLKDLGFDITQLNMPSATCCAALPKLLAAGATHGEPGNGLTGTTPYHVNNYGVERPAIVYISEVTHCLGNRSYCLGGGNYSRGHLEHALVQWEQHREILPIMAPSSDNIDYHFELVEKCPVGSTVLMCFRTQMFVTRSQIGLVEGLSKGSPRLLGFYSPQGEKLEDY